MFGKNNKYMRDLKQRERLRIMVFVSLVLVLFQ